MVKGEACNSIAKDKTKDCVQLWHFVKSMFWLEEGRTGKETENNNWPGFYDVMGWLCFDTACMVSQCVST